MTIPFHLEDLSQSYGHSMRVWTPEFGRKLHPEGIPVDPDYETSVIPQYRISEYGGKGTPTATEAFRE